MRRWLARSLGNESGAVAIEMAFALPIFIVFLIGFLGLSHVFWIYNSLVFSADQAGRHTIIHPTATSTEITTVARNNLLGISNAPLTVTVTSSTNGSVPVRTITLSYNYMFGNTSPLMTMVPTNLSTSVTVPAVP